jgi:hypothetical protein
MFYSSSWYSRLAAWLAHIPARHQGAGGEGPHNPIPSASARCSLQQHLWVTARLPLEYAAKPAAAYKEQNGYAWSLFPGLPPTVKELAKPPAIQPLTLARWAECFKVRTPRGPLSTVGQVELSEPRSPTTGPGSRLSRLGRPRRRRSTAPAFRTGNPPRRCLEFE